MAKRSTNSPQLPAAVPLTAAASAILDVAEQLAQTRGYNGFSYADIAVRLGVTKASLHYHFRSKEALGSALVERYHRSFAEALADIDRRVAAPFDRLREYVGLYDSVMRDDRMCLCGMLAAEYATLPGAMQKGLTAFFDMNERWLTAVLGQGIRAGDLRITESANERARMILGALEGAMLVARSYGDPRRFTAATEHVLSDLHATGARRGAAHARRSVSS